MQRVSREFLILKLKEEGNALYELGDDVDFERLEEFGYGKIRERIPTAGSVF